MRPFIPARKGVIKASNADNIAHNTNPPVPSYTDTASVAADQPGSQVKSDTDLVVSSPKENVVQNKDSVMAQKTDEVKTSQIHSEDSVIQSPEKGKIIEGNNIVVDFNNSLLQGNAVMNEPDQFKGIAVLIKKGRNITLKNLSAKGYKIAWLRSSSRRLRK